MAGSATPDLQIESGCHFNGVTLPTGPTRSTNMPGRPKLVSNEHLPLWATDAVEPDIGIIRRPFVSLDGDACR